MSKIAEMVKGVKDSVINLGLSMIAEELEMYDEYLRKQARMTEEAEAELLKEAVRGKERRPDTTGK